MAKCIQLSLLKCACWAWIWTLMFIGHYTRTKTFMTCRASARSFNTTSRLKSMGDVAYSYHFICDTKFRKCLLSFYCTRKFIKLFFLNFYVCNCKMESHQLIWQSKHANMPQTVYNVCQRWMLAPYNYAEKRSVNVEFGSLSGWFAFNNSYFSFKSPF